MKLDIAPSTKTVAYIPKICITIYVQVPEMLDINKNINSDVVKT